MKSVAFARKDRPGKVLLWCTRKGKSEKHFDVINGHWTAIFDGEAITCLEVPSDPIPSILVWEGYAPFPEFEYDGAMNWIENQVANGNNGNIDTVLTNEKLAEIGPTQPVTLYGSGLVHLMVEFNPANGKNRFLLVIRGTLFSKYYHSYSNAIDGFNRAVLDTDYFIAHETTDEETTNDQYDDIAF